MNPNIDQQILQADQRRDQLMREADAARKTSELMSISPVPRYAKTLARVGRLMSDIGERLQSRYAV